MHILSLPNEIIAEIEKYIILPADIVNLSTACGAFYENNKGKVKWFANMRNVIKEINSIEYTIADMFKGLYMYPIDFQPKSCRKRNNIITYSYTSKISGCKPGHDGRDLNVKHNIPINLVNKHHKKRTLDDYKNGNVKIYKETMANRHVPIYIHWYGLCDERCINGKVELCYHIAIRLV